MVFSFITKPLLFLALFTCISGRTSASWISKKVNGPASQANSKKICESPLERSINQTFAVIESNLFITHRNLDYYIADLNLGRTLEKINQDGGHWIDMGAGNGFAQQTFLERNPESKNIKCTGVAVEAPNKFKEKIESVKQTDPTRYNYITGYVEHLDIDTWEKADLITDYFGPLTYSIQPDEVLRRYASLLKPKGVLKVYFKKMATTVIDHAGNELGFFEWINTVPGIEVKSEEYLSRMDNASITIEFKQEIQIPYLTPYPVKHSSREVIPIQVFNLR